MHRNTAVFLLVVWALLMPSAWASIDTDFIQRPWPHQWVHDLEVGRYPARWRQRASKTDGIFAGVRFEVPLSRQAAWDLSSDYQDIGKMTPGVTAVRYLERTANREVIQVDVKVLWKTLQLTFEVEKEPPKAMRFRLVNEVLGEYRGVCLLEEPPSDGTNVNASPRTSVELATWVKPSRPIPMGLLLLVERVTMLRAAKRFVNSCEQRLSR